VGYPLQILGRVVQISGAIIVIILTAMLLARTIFSNFGFFNAFVYYLGGIFAIICGRYVFHIGKKIAAKTAPEIMHEDKRNPVLYLRSFIDDEVTARIFEKNSIAQVAGKSWFAFLVPGVRNDLTLSVTTEEEMLAKVLNRIGPCVAVGCPDEKLPKLGIARMYFDNENWEKGVQQLMESAELVVMRAGLTKGFLRELEMVVKFLNPKKLLILLPNAKTSRSTVSNEQDWYTEFRESAGKTLPKELPVFSGGNMTGASLSGIMWFDQDWTPKTLRFEDDPFEVFFESLSKRYAHYGVLHWGE
jgi:hypothetical protein